MKSRSSPLILLGVLAAYSLFLLPLKQVCAQTDSRDLRVQATSQAERRVALVIGNSTYKDSPLLNPGNDARAMAGSLHNFGFEVLYGENLSQNDIKRNIRSFGEKIRNGGVGLFYYAGHGIQVRGSNYLIPVGATITSEDEVEYESVDVGLVMAQMETARNRLNIVILDACRNNPFARSFRSAQKGLASIDAPSGTLIAYATAPGSVASDGTQGHGLYTQQLLKYMRVPGLSIEQVFKQVRVAVRSQTQGKQIPWESSSLEGDFYFSATPVSANPAPTARSHSIKGDQLADDNKWAEAEAEYRQAMQLEPDNAVWHHKVYLSLLRQKKYQESRDALKQLRQMRKWAEIEAEYRQGIGLEPQRARTHAELGNAQAIQQKWAEAEAEFRQAIKIDPNDAAAHRSLGSALTAQQKYAEAEAEFRQAIKIDPNEAYSHSGIGTVLAFQQKYAEAEAEYRQAISIDPNSFGHHFNLGWALNDQQRYAEAEAEYRQAIKIDPNDAPPHTYLGVVLERQQKYAEAEAEYRQALRIDPNFSLAQTNLKKLLEKK
jgi:uncharacterized caspase-like protein